MNEGPRRVGLITIVRALGPELRGVGATLARMRGTLWFGNGVVLLSASCVGMLPLGWPAFAMQVLGFLLVALYIAWPENFARVLRSDEEFGVRERHSATVVTYLPVAVAIFALPFYLLAQTVLFWRVMQHFPGVLSETGWAGAWRLSLDNLLFTELFLDLFDVFGLGLAAQTEELAGRLLIFVTRLMLSLGFVRIAIAIARAAFYRAHGLGRGSDAIGALESAVAAGDAVYAGYLAREIVRDVHGTIDILLERMRVPEQRESAARCVRAMRDWAVPYLRKQIAYADARAEHLQSVLRELNTPRTLSDPAPPRSRPWSAAGIALAVASGIAVVVWSHPAAAFAVGSFGMLAICWLLVQPRSSYEWGMERGVLPFVELEGLRAAMLTWIAVLAALFLGDSWATLWHAASLWPETFESPQGIVDRSTVLQFVAASLVRVQLFLSIPELFGIVEPRIEQQPWIGSLLTLMLRTGLNLGFVAVILSGLTIVRDREGMAGLVSASDDLAMRIEALRGGRYAQYLLYYHDLLLGQRLWKALDAAADADTQNALIVSGVFDWCTTYASFEEASSPERLRSQSAIIEALYSQGSEHRDGWVRELDAALEAGDWPPAIRVQVLARRAVVAAKAGDIAEAVRLLETSNGGLLDRDPKDADASREAAAVWSRSVIRVGALLPPESGAHDAAAALFGAAAERLTALAAEQPDRFAIDRLRIDTLRAALTGRRENPARGAAELERVCNDATNLPPDHLWRETLLIQLLVAVLAMAALGEGETDPALQRLETRLLDALGRLDTGWDPDELAAQAYDERLGEELAQPVMMLTHLPPSRAAYVAAMRAAEVFRARWEVGVIETRGYAVALALIAAKMAYRVQEYAGALSAAEQAVKCAEGVSGMAPDDAILLTAHGIGALAAQALGQGEAAAAHAASARRLYDRVAASDWKGAPAALEGARVYFEGFAAEQ